MKGEKAKELCLALMKADSEEEVIKILTDVGYWDNQTVWHFYGNYENNYNTIGNQQSRPDSALVEKLVNSVDARLMNECLAQKINPEDASAPQSIHDAVARFFDNATGNKTAIAGRIGEWMTQKRTEVARGITLTATGLKPGSGNPCFTISDKGEGQTPEQMPDTLLSLNRSNKLRIPFVQGKFNMGGTGVLKFCGKRNLQLIITRRNPAILKHPINQSQDDNKWSFTIVRREDPQGNRRSSVYTYLAPVEAVDSSNSCSVLRFYSDNMPLFPNGKNPYEKEAEWGTLIKLYEYAATGFKSHILMKDGLLGRVDLLLPDIALPMRFHECRDYKGHEGSFETTLTGVRVRLEDGKGENLEEGFPASAPTMVAGEEMLVAIYAFKKGKADAYRKNEGIIFVVNGQTHGHLTVDFFSRKRVGLSYLADSILVIVDCTKLSGRAREDLFMNSRDRLSGGELRQHIEESLEELLKQHEGLRTLKERRRREEIESKLDDAKPLEDILEKLLKQSPTLSNLFLKGLRASTPFKTMEAQAQEQEFKGIRFPTYFKFKGKEYGDEMHRDCHINMRCRLTFETDAENEYFSRAVDPGEFHLNIEKDVMPITVENYVLNLQNGVASLSIPLPSDVEIGRSLRYQAIVNDCSRLQPFINTFIVTVKDAQHPSGDKASRRKPPSKQEGHDRERTAGIQLPNVVLVEEKEWQNHSPPFDKYTGMRIRNTGNSGDAEAGTSSVEVYDFLINMDNLYLKTELKTTKSETDLVRAQFKYGMVLIGLALLQQDMASQQKQDDSEEKIESENGANIEKTIEEFAKAIAPVLIPMINSLGSLSLEDGTVANASGEAT
jgi:hypothetical protein